MNRFGITLAIGMSIFALSPQRLHAQRELSGARRLFENGLEAARRERWQEARDLFQRSLDIAERPNTLLNLAGAEAQTGRLVSAAEHYRRYLAIAESAAPALRDQASTALESVEARLPHVELQIDALAEDDDIELDDRPLPREELGRAIPLDPGPHVVTILREGTIVGAQRFDLGQSEMRQVDVQLHAAEAPSPVVAPSGGSDDAWIWALGIGLAIAAGAGIGVGVWYANEPHGTPTHMGNLGGGVVTALTF